MRHHVAPHTQQAAPVSTWRGARGEVLATLALLVSLLPSGTPLFAQDDSSGDLVAEAPATYRFSGEFKLIDVTSRAREGDIGFAHEGDDTRSDTAAALRLMWSDTGGAGPSWELHYANVKLDSAQARPPGATGAELFRSEPLRWSIESAETDGANPSSAQTVTWYHELDRASAGWRGEGWDLTAGRQPITWGAGRFWQPLDVFGTFAPTELEREFKPGVDALVAQLFPSAFSALTAAIVASPEGGDTDGSAVLHGRMQVGAESELSALTGSVRERTVAGGSIETSAWDAGWRLEVLAARYSNGSAPEERGDDTLFVVAGVDRQFESGITAALEWYHHSAGARRAEELTEVALSAAYRQGTQQQLSRDVAGLSLQQDLTGLLNGSYTLLAGQLEGGTLSTLHQATLTYSIADEADATFSLISATGRGLNAFGAPRSEFGHIPDSFYVRLRFYF